MATLERSYNDLAGIQMLEHEGISPLVLKAAEALGPKNLAPRMNEETVTLEIDKKKEAAAEALAERAWQREQEQQTD